jgi:hypothetical protein
MARTDGRCRVKKWSMASHVARCHDCNGRFLAVEAVGAAGYGPYSATVQLDMNRDLDPILLERSSPAI